MTDAKPKLEVLRRRSPGELASCEGYLWHLKTRIGKGSFGEVYLGWNTSGTMEVAVKVVKKEFFKQDPKVRENLEREIRIMKLLRGCDYVVRLLHVQELKATIVMVMELCEYDLDHLVKVQPFSEEDTTLLLFELAQGMKALREQNIVHRDLKPGNILIRKHPITGKMMIKLADFGFARHFKDEGMKPIDMTSLAGTPVFMAPEALRCVFHPGEHYDDKVDIWSIGALMYKVIVGSCGFYAQLQDIPRILKHKGDAIAFERVPHSRKITYINELPASVNDRLTESYREKMNRLLRSMLKIDPTDRMNFTEFFEFVDDIITSKVEVINLLHGTTLKVILDPKMTSEQLMQAVETEFQVPSKAQVLFSNASPLFLSPGQALSQQQFSELLNAAGGSRGHAVLYVLPINHVLKEQVVADQRCFTLLKFAIEEETVVDLVLEHKFSDEIVHAIGQLQAQQRRQLAGLEEFFKFTTLEVGKFSSQSYRQLTEAGHRALAKVEVVSQWLRDDITSLGGAGQLPALLQAVEGQRQDIEVCVRELQGFNGLLQLAVEGNLTEDSIKAAGTLQEEAKRLGKIRRDHIQASCRGILDDCLKITQEASGKILKELQRLYNSLAQVWSLGQKSVLLNDRCYTLDQLLGHISQERAVAMRSLAGPVVVRDRRAQTTPHTPPVVVTPVGGVAPSSPSWNSAHPPQANVFPGTPPPIVAWGGQQQQQQQQQPPTNTDALQKENVKLQGILDSKNKECATLTLKVQQLSERRRSGDSTGYDEEQGTIRPGELQQQQRHNRAPSPLMDVESTMKPAGSNGGGAEGGGGGGGGRLNPDDTRLLEALGTQLQHFCLTAEKLQPGISSESLEHRDKAQASALYPNLLEDYSVISMPDEHKKSAVPPPMPSDVQTLIPQAAKLSRLLQSNVTSLESIVKSSAMTPYSGFVKIAKPTQYEEGDVVLFHPTKMHRSKSTAPAMLHLDKPRPYVMMDFSSYNNFNIRPGRMPDMIVAKLTEKPRSFRFEDHKEMAGDLAESSGEFFRVKAEPTELRFATTRPSSRAPVRPPAPTVTTPTTSDRSPRTSQPKHHLFKKGGKEYV